MINISSLPLESRNLRYSDILIKRRESRASQFWQDGGLVEGKVTQNVRWIKSSAISYVLAALTAAERAKRYREKKKCDLKKYEEFRKKENARHKMFREKETNKYISDEDIQRRRSIWRERKKRQNERLRKLEKVTVEPLQVYEILSEGFQIPKDPNNAIYCDEEENYEISKNIGIGIKVEPGLADMYQYDVSDDDAKDFSAGCSRLKEEPNQDSLNGEGHLDFEKRTYIKQEDGSYVLVSSLTAIKIKELHPDFTNKEEHPDSLIDVDGTSYIKQEDESYLSSAHTDIKIKALTGAERAKRSREKMKSDPKKYEEFKKKEKARHKIYRDKKRNKYTSNTDIRQRRRMCRKQRKKQNNRLKKHEQLTVEPLQVYEELHPDFINKEEHPDSLIDVDGTSYIKQEDESYLSSAHTDIKIKYESEKVNPKTDNYKIFCKLNEEDWETENTIILRAYALF
ncbi:uncharacterized protein [Halyomorpha halys]|uniref:uncharacterized protein n=1 Tax=Halyomorpha halys TaxID=286706 RepID=UPI0006D4E736|nr:uncharacterized protein LOC106687994 [Halyomorpha halys]